MRKKNLINFHVNDYYWLYITLLMREEQAKKSNKKYSQVCMFFVFYQNFNKNLIISIKIPT